MAGTGLGAFAGEFLKNYSGARSQKKKDESDEKQKKLILKLMEAQLSDAEAKQEALGLITRRIGGQGDPIPKMTEAPGGLGFEKTGEIPAQIKGPGMSLSAMLASQDPQVQAALLRSGALPQVQQGAQSQSQARLGELVSGSGMPINQAFQQPEIAGAGLAAGLSPAQMMGNQSALPPFVAELMAFGINPTSDEGRKLFFQKYSNVSDDVYRQLQAQLQMYQIDNLARDRETEITDQNRQHRELGSAIKNTFRKAEELSELNDRLEKTALSTGQPFGRLYRSVIAGGAPVLESFGIDTGNAAQIVSDFDVFDKLANDIVIDMVSRLQNSGVTNFQLQSLQRTSAGVGTSPGANRAVLSELLQTTLDAADINDIEIPNRDEVETLIESLRTREATTAPVVADVPGTIRSVADMTDAQLQAIINGVQ